MKMNKNILLAVILLLFIYMLTTSCNNGYNEVEQFESTIPSTENSAIPSTENSAIPSTENIDATNLSIGLNHTNNERSMLHGSSSYKPVQLENKNNEKLDELLSSVLSSQDEDNLKGMDTNMSDNMSDNMPDNMSDNIHNNTLFNKQSINNDQPKYNNKSFDELVKMNNILERITGDDKTKSVNKLNNKSDNKTENNANPNIILNSVNIPSSNDFEIDFGMDHSKFYDSDSDSDSYIDSDLNSDNYNDSDTEPIEVSDFDYNMKTRSNNYKNINTTDDDSCDMSSKCSAKTCGSESLHPILDPRFNMRECAKQCLLLEDHMNNVKKRCFDCIRKHFLIVDGLLEESVSLEQNIKKRDYYRDLYLRWLGFEKQYAKNARDSNNLDEISKQIRVFRKPLVEEHFDLVKDYEL
jgi:hypothetical protein